MKNKLIVRNKLTDIAQKTCYEFKNSILSKLLIMLHKMQR